MSDGQDIALRLVTQTSPVSEVFLALQRIVDVHVGRMALHAGFRQCGFVARCRAVDDVRQVPDLPCDLAVEWVRLQREDEAIGERRLRDDEPIREKPRGIRQVVVGWHDQSPKERRGGLADVAIGYGV